MLPLKPTTLQAELPFDVAAQVGNTIISHGCCSVAEQPPEDLGTTIALTKPHLLAHARIAAAMVTHPRSTRHTIRPGKCA